MDPSLVRTRAGHSRVHQSTGEVAVADVKWGDQDLQRSVDLDRKGPDPSWSSPARRTRTGPWIPPCRVVGSVDLITVEPVGLSGKRNPESRVRPLGGQAASAPKSRRTTGILEATAALMVSSGPVLAWVELRVSARATDEQFRQARRRP